MTTIPVNGFLPQIVQIGARLGTDWLAAGKTVALDFDGLTGHSVVMLDNVDIAGIARWWMGDKLSLGGKPVADALHVDLEGQQIREQITINPIVVAALLGMREASGRAPVLFTAMPEFRLRLLAAAASSHPMARGLFMGLLGEDFSGRISGDIMDRIDAAIGAGLIITRDQTADALVELLRQFRRRLQDPTERFSVFPGSDEQAMLTFLDQVDPRDNPLKWEARTPADRDLDILLGGELGNHDPCEWKPRSVLRYDVLVDDSPRNAALAVSCRDDDVLALVPGGPFQDGWGMAFGPTEARQQMRKISGTLAGMRAVFEDWASIRPGSRGFRSYGSTREDPREGIIPFVPPVEIAYDGHLALLGYGDPTRRVRDEIVLTRAALEARAEAQRTAHVQARGALLTLLDDDASFREAPPHKVRKNARKALEPEKREPPEPPKDVAGLELLTRPTRFMTDEARGAAFPAIAAWADQQLAQRTHRRGGGGTSFVTKLTSGLGKFLKGGLQAFTGKATDMMMGNLWTRKGIVRHPIGYLMLGLSQVRSLRRLIPASWQYRALGFVLEQVFNATATAAFDRLLASGHLDEERQRKLTASRGDATRRFGLFSKRALRRLPLRAYRIAREISEGIKDFKEGWKALGGELRDKIAAGLGDVLKGEIREMYDRVADRRDVYHLLIPDLRNSDDLYRIGHLLLHELNLLFGGDHTPMGQLIRQAQLAWDVEPEKALKSLVRLPDRLALYWGATSLSKTTKRLGMGSLEVTQLHDDAKRLSDYLVQGNQEAADELMLQVAGHYRERRPDKEGAREGFEDFLIVASTLTPDEFYQGLKAAAQKAYDEQLDDDKFPKED